MAGTWMSCGGSSRSRSRSWPCRTGRTRGLRGASEVVGRDREDEPGRVRRGHTGGADAQCAVLQIGIHLPDERVVAVGFVRGHGVQDVGAHYREEGVVPVHVEQGFLPVSGFRVQLRTHRWIKAKVLRNVRACGLKPRQSLAHRRYGLPPIRSPMLRLATCIVFLRQGLLLSTHYRQYQAASEAAVRVTSSLHALSAFGRYHPSQALKDNYATAISRLGAQLGDHTSQD
jgi:hypothetical protein